MKNRPLSLLGLAAFSAVLLSGCSTFSAGPVGNVAVPQPAKSVELSRYLGRWYEMARYEAGFQKDCEAVTADYSLKENGMVSVLNSCRMNSVDGKAKVAKGRAKIVEGSDGAKLRVSFFGPFFGNYWVLDRDDDYSWAIVGEPSGRYLWLLTRTANPDEEVKAAILKRTSDLGYDLALLRTTQHARIAPDQ